MKILLITVKPSYGFGLRIIYTYGLCGIICLRTRTLFKVIPWEVDLKLYFGRLSIILSEVEGLN